MLCNTRAVMLAYQKCRDLVQYIYGLTRCFAFAIVCGGHSDCAVPGRRIKLVFQLRQRRLVEEGARGVLIKSARPYVQSSHKRMLNIYCRSSHTSKDNFRITRLPSSSIFSRVRPWL